MKVRRYRSLPSTQTLARRLAEEGAPHGTVVRADVQTRGRGRMRRRWASRRGGLYFSIILRPRMKPAGLPALSLRLARLCARSLSELSGLKTVVKPPNDVLAFPKPPLKAPRKVCGILLEASGDTRKVDWIAAGIGINVANRLPPSLRKAGSLSALSGRRLSPDRVLRRLLRELP